MKIVNFADILSLFYVALIHFIKFLLSNEATLITKTDIFATILEVRCDSIYFQKLQSH